MLPKHLLRLELSLHESFKDWTLNVERIPVDHVHGIERSGCANGSEVVGVHEDGVEHHVDEDRERRSHLPRQVGECELRANTVGMHAFHEGRIAMVRVNARERARKQTWVKGPNRLVDLFLFRRDTTSCIQIAFSCSCHCPVPF